ncbi:MAG: hypothetical protein C0498_05005 [Anaerolinea sp.]|jgi:hypothetical protein|nr:hypothetical protein [Anaerolinea sp.]
MADLLSPISTEAPVVSGPGRPARVRPGGGAPDAFLKQAGPDVRVNGPAGPLALFAVFTVDPETDEVQVAVFDERGLVRLIPPDSVSEMIAAMRAYRP